MVSWGLPAACISLKVIASRRTRRLDARLTEQSTGARHPSPGRHDERVAGVGMHHLDLDVQSPRIPIVITGKMARVCLRSPTGACLRPSDARIGGSARLDLRGENPVPDRVGADLVDDFDSFE